MDPYFDISSAFSYLRRPIICLTKAPLDKQTERPDFFWNELILPWRKENEDGADLNYPIIRCGGAGVQRAFPMQMVDLHCDIKFAVPFLGR